MQKAGTPSMAGFLSYCLAEENQSLQLLGSSIELDNISVLAGASS
jgi:hypothetical protein